MSFQVDQSGATAGGDVVGNNKYEQHFHPPAKPLGVVEQLLEKLQREMANDDHVRHTIEALAHFQKQKSHDGVVGLEAKLNEANRQDEYRDAIEKKEIFAKLLDRWSMYASAQEIFAYLLAKAEYEFTYVIHPQLPQITKVATNELVRDRIIDPIIQECGSKVFTLNHMTVMGMIYWLAEQCFVRWHP
ncbi:ABC-three component system protein [Bradyrhizobium zhanjiangense]|uniref:ABC-three component systems C-terminal domain-containing protein n=1 Tax=Bradyrhizobium zhanjiangense TaxID=1325107 RepID=A0A4Q0S9Y1_9BRAD|nr:ABC-three component system protein [Bradyrhizobium zhanjiangense]RXH34392.1 hypothetical protein XH94_28035 [Bradyrhizobium zhanjiangense]